MKLVISFILFISSMSFAASFNHNCQPVYSSVMRSGVLSTFDVQSYSWGLVYKAMPSALTKKMEVLFSQSMVSNLYSSRARINNLEQYLNNECYRHDFIINELTANSTCSGQLFENRIENSTDITLYRNYCHVKNIKSVPEMFSLKADLPAEFIGLWSGDYLSANYNHTNPAIAEMVGIDAEIFFQLNIEAEKIWNSILACEGNDFEKARSAVYTGKFNCPGTEGEFRNLTINIANYFSSSNSINQTINDYFSGNYVPGTISSHSALLAGQYALEGKQRYVESMLWDGKKRGPVRERWAGQSIRKYRNNTNWFGEQYDSFINADLQRFSNFDLRKLLTNRVQIHPLFSQIVMEVLATQTLSSDLVDDFGKVYSLKNLFPAKEVDERLKNLNTNISNFSLTYLERMCEPVGLWPSAGFSAMLRVQRRISLGLPLRSEKSYPTQYIGPEDSGDLFRIGYWAFDFGKAQLNCRRDKVLPQIYYDDTHLIIKEYKKMFLRHIFGE